MAFLVPNKSSSNEIPAEQGSPVSSCLYIRSASDAGADGTSVAARQLLDKDLVLRRIRHHKRVSQIDTALRPLARTSQELADVEAHGPSKWWLDDAFSSP